MRLSVIIVNYNVRFFLEQCLHSVRKALQNIDGEVFVVDNNSVDGSMTVVKDLFPEVIRIENKENLGFSKANNQAIRVAKGEHVLLLNPDTVVEEDTFEKVLTFMDEHPEAGALGVKMIDGKGHFLPESKRALPTPWISFYKVFGLSWLFPKSKIFGQYHLGYLDKEKIHEIDILPGAFMWLRKKALDKSGLLDETFFMYGEDIDLSYRITQAGYKNYYFPETTIIHYKGESTKKSSVNYVLVFYQAMQIFANKHFSTKNARLFNITIHAAIYFRMGLAILRRFFEKAFYPIFDLIIASLGFLVINHAWEQYKWGADGSHPQEYLVLFIPIYTLIWVLSIFFAGGYDRPYSTKKLIQGILIGSLIILSAYSLLPSSYRFSRALILLGSAWTLTSFVAMRLLLNKVGGNAFKLLTKRSKRVVIVGKSSGYERIRDLSKVLQSDIEIIGRVDTGLDDELSGTETLGNMDSLSEIVEINRIQEIIFSSSDLSTQQIIQVMLSLKDSHTDYKIASPESPSIIGSNSINTAGDLYVIDMSSIATPGNRRNKRIFDLLSALFLILTLPLYFWLILPKLGKYLRNVLQVLIGKRSWIGYYAVETDQPNLLPKIKKGILNPRPDLPKPDQIMQNELNLKYARDYHLWDDIRIFTIHFKGIL